MRHSGEREIKGACRSTGRMEEGGGCTGYYGMVIMVNGYHDVVEMKDKILLYVLYLQVENQFGYRVRI